MTKKCFKKSVFMYLNSKYTTKLKHICTYLLVGGEGQGEILYEEGE